MLGIVSSWGRKAWRCCLATYQHQVRDAWWLPPHRTTRLSSRQHCQVERSRSQLIHQPRGPGFVSPQPHRRVGPLWHDPFPHLTWSLSTKLTPGARHSTSCLLENRPTHPVSSPTPSTSIESRETVKLLPALVNLIVGSEKGAKLPGRLKLPPASVTQNTSDR